MPKFKLREGESRASLLFILAGLLWSIAAFFSGNVGLYVPIAMMFIIIGLSMQGRSKPKE